MRRVFVTCLIACLVAAASASADVGKAPDQFGLIGTWALVDCDQPASPGNNRQVWTRDADGTLAHTVDAGTTLAINRYRFDQAELVGDDKIVLDGVLLRNGHRRHVTLEKRAGKVRVFSNRDVTDDRMLVDGGVILGNGRQAIWAIKCPS